MDRAEHERRHECWRTHCRYLTRCLIYWGSRCNRQGGKKIPRIAVIKNSRFARAAVEK